MSDHTKQPDIGDWVYQSDDNGRKKYGKITQIVIDGSGEHALVEWLTIDPYKTMHDVNKDVVLLEDSPNEYDADEAFKRGYVRGYLEGHSDGEKEILKMVSDAFNDMRGEDD